MCKVENGSHLIRNRDGETKFVCSFPPTVDGVGNHVCWCYHSYNKMEHFFSCILAAGWRNVLPLQLMSMPPVRCS